MATFERKIPDIKQELTIYCKKVVKNKIVSCIAFKQACQRFLDDIKREGTKDFPYVFDNEEAHKFFVWSRMFKHTKGVIAGQKIEFTPDQRFIYGNIFGWQYKDVKPKKRRFNKVYYQVARKQAKSQGLAIVGSYLTFANGENQGECYIAATRKDQARLIFDEMVSQLKGARYLDGKWNLAYSTITHLKSGSKVVPLSKDSGKKGDGTNPSVGLVDEYHLHDTEEVYEVLESGMVSRYQPLLCIITTAGFNLDSPCFRVVYKYCKEILDPDNPITNDNYFVAIFELDANDDPFHLPNLEKANPIVYNYPEGREYLIKQMTIAKDVPEKRRSYLTKNCNIWIDDKETVLIPLNIWRKNATTFPDFTGRTCYIGLDLSKKIDLTAVSFIFPDKDFFYVHTHCFMPEETLREKEHTDKVPYKLWREQGFLTTTPGSIIDYNYIQAYINRQLELNKWVAKEICYDPWSATQFALEMELDGHVIVEVPQNLKRMSEPTKAFRDLTYQGKILHEDNPLFNWCLGNAIAKTDHLENIMLDKSKSTNRIDPVVATIIALTRALHHDIGSAKAAQMNNHFSGANYSL